MSLIHPSASVHPSARIHPSVFIGPAAVIGEDVEIGEGSSVGAHAVVEFAALGRNNKLHPGCYVGTAPQDIKYAGERTRLVMGDDNTVRECVTLNRGTSAHGETRIGNGCLFMAYSHVAHDCRIGNGVILVNSVAVAGHVEIDDFTVVGGLAAIHQYLRIGKYCMLGGGSMLNKDVPPFCTCQGYPAVLRGLNAVGLRRGGFSREAIASIKKTYKTVFLSGLVLEDALAVARRETPAPEAAQMLDFIAQSKRGVMRPSPKGAREDQSEAVL